MNRVAWIWALIITMAACGGEPGFVVEPPEDFILVWEDDFDGTPGDLANEERWSYDIGTGPNGDGFGNDELPFYTNEPANGRLGVANTPEMESVFIMEALEEERGGRLFTSARIRSRADNEFDLLYGRVEIRARVAGAAGMWSGARLLGPLLDPDATPTQGEISVFEHDGALPTGSFGRIRAPGYGEEPPSLTNPAFQVRADSAFGPPLDQDFNIFRVDWDPTRVVWSVETEEGTTGSGIGASQIILNGTCTFSQTVCATNLDCDIDTNGDGDFDDLDEDQQCIPNTWVFNRPDQRFVVLLSLSVGGSFVDSPGPETTFPQRMEIDYVRVYERNPNR